MKCKNCDLYIHSAPTCIPGYGEKHCDIMIVNSSANDNDEAVGHAVMDKVLLSQLKDIECNPNDVYYTNAIKCRTPREVKIKVTEIKRCKPHLEKEILKIKPKYILLIGAQAAKALTNDSITSINGVVQDGCIGNHKFKFVATFAPGIIYRDPSKADYVIQALNNFKDLLQGSVKELPKQNLHIIKNKAQLNKALQYLKDHNYYKIAYDIEATGLNRFKDNVTLFGFGNDAVQFIIPLQVKHSPLRSHYITQRKLVRYLIRYLNNNMLELIAQNGKFDDLFVETKFGIKPIITFDTLLASHALNENIPHGLKENAVKFCNAIDWDIDKNLKTGNVKTLTDYKNYTTYLGYDILYTFRCYKVFRERLRDDKSIYKIFKHIYMPMARAYEEIQSNGVYINQEQFKKVEDYLRTKLNDIEKKLLKYSKGKKYNWNSSQQMAQFLFKDLKLPIVEYTKTGNPATGESILKRLQDKHPAVETLLQYRGVHIQITHFVDGWIKRMHKGKLYPNFKLYGTVTGRTSSNNPNLQQVPRDKTIRSLIAAPPGKVFVEADLSQAELRIAALMSGDDTMKSTYQHGGDIHNKTYDAIADDRIEDEKDPGVKKEKRKKAKAVNFGFVYGMGWKKFKDYARDNYGLKLSDKEAKKYRTNFFEMYDGLPAWHIRQRKIVHSQKQVRSPIGRLRRLPDIDSSEPGKVAEAERQAINSPVQGFGSDICLMGMSEALQYAKYINPQYVLDKTKFQVEGSVHDSIIAIVDIDYAEEYCYKIKHIVQEAKVITKVFHFKPDVPIIMDVAIGQDWGHLEELDFDGDWKGQIHKVLENMV